MLRYIQMMFSKSKSTMPTASEALPGRAAMTAVPEFHYVSGARMQEPYPPNSEMALFGLGCFWGAERKFWQTDGVLVTSVGYAGGFTPNPTYEEVCSGRTGHAEVVLVVFDPAIISYDGLLKIFWENHDPTQGMRQGGDVGTQYRSVIYTFNDNQLDAAKRSRDAYQSRLTDAGFGTITTEIIPAPPFFFAEAYHQQYLAKNPNGYCNLGGVGVSCPIGLANVD
ncbi:peptide-methionine (S)-S-oxide reductase MsrA [Acidiphilium sp. PA]|uniref:peptide-methionine (S)-S-oxide reductase MsrA n=1 Tax=Acidiphilium sp. PA TaxID=2871705 RepID=UPI002243680E|nr:peptide-methionine (S)-S-oxide reductase MsrA [Acidiphilium sp. PA]MCW8308323.1 peptide-methionine (S)-S-oxide reductase MsrA [Acidiphilium sp. PA]